jgi:hypothetical protein
MNTQLRPFRLITLIEAMKIAELRFTEAVILNLNNATTYQSDVAEIMTRSIGGILAELVIGRKFDRFFFPSINTFHKQADVGQDIEVRSTPHENGSLILRDNDDAARRYVFVVCDPMRGFHVRGWVYGYEAMTDEWRKTDEGRPAWWFRGTYRPHETLTLQRPDDAKMPLEYKW